MPALEIFIAAFIRVLSEKLASDEFLRFARQQGIHDQLNIWKEKLLLIQAVLSDAAEKQTTNYDVKSWLEDVGDLAYDMDDILDKLSTEEASSRSRSNLMDDDQATTSKMIMNYFIPTTTCCTNFNLPSVFLFDHCKLRSEMGKITIRLQVLVDGMRDFHLTENLLGTWSNRLTEREHTFSFVEEPNVIGRENEKREIVEILLKDIHEEEEEEEANPEVIPIVGMGGIGKTTLAQLVYNDEKVKRHFDIIIWVCVSQDFDIFRITKEILESVTRKRCEIKYLDLLQQSLMKKLSKRRFLLVLDDVWNEDNIKWDALLHPLRAGAPGSKIILTTRIPNVASLTGTSVSTFHLIGLKPEDCLSILAHHALDTSNFDAHPDLKSFGEAIAKRCGGWDLEDSPILPALRLSYEHLPSNLKLLFAYCSIFPYDYEFDMDDLVLLWMAEGFLQQSVGEKPMEELGYEYFNELLSRSFFQSSSRCESQFVMPNLINDLARVVAGKRSFKWDSKTRSGQENQVLKMAHHSSFIRRKYEVLKNFKNFHGIKALRTFLPLPIFAPDWQEFYLSNGVLTDLLPRLQCLRVLSFSGYSISEIPESIGDLKHIRYLNFSDTLIRCLPESVSNLYNLQTLLLRRCRRLTKLPTGIGNLINLRHLDCTETNQLREMPPGIGNLKNLRTLSKIVLGKDNGLGELRSLSHIQGRLAIMGLHTVTNIQDAKEVLSNKNGVDEVIMEWCYSFYDSLNRRREKEVLDVVQPTTNLKKLNIILYGGTEFPTWVGHTSFSSMVDLELRNCKQCTSLPSLGQLPSLKNLHIHGIDRLESVGVEFYGDVVLRLLFLHLKVLVSRRCPIGRIGLR